jgi:nucleoside-diphosphate-sugar epimerase
MKKILITGAAGFLGSHLSDRFIKEGYHVIGMDNLSTGNIKNIEHLFPNKNFEYYHHDVTKFCTYIWKFRFYPTLCFSSFTNRLSKNAYPNFKSWCYGYL